MGISSTGYTARTQTQIVESLETFQRANIDPNLDVSAESVVGQFNGVFSRELALVEELAESIYDSHDPDKATGAALTSLAKLTGTARRGAEFTTFISQCGLEAGTQLISGTHFAQVVTDSGSRWTPVEDYTASFTGVQSVPFRAEFTGPVTVTEGTVTVIATAVTGWTSVNNPTPETVGRVGDDDPTLRDRRDADVARTGSATVAAIRADVLAADDSIQGVNVFTNRTDDTNAQGMPPHSVEVLVSDGVSPTVDNDVIAQAIYDTVGAGVTIYGSQSGTAIDPDSEEEVTVPFTRPTFTSIYIRITVVTDENYAGNAAFRTWLADQGNAGRAAGQDVYWRRMDSLAFNYPGVLNVTAFTIGTAPNPGTAVDIPIGSREVANFDGSNITVTNA